VDAAIRAATLELLAGMGYARLTMDQVAARARVSKSSLYLRWPNKVALVADALQHRARAVPEVPDTSSLPGDMRAFLGGLLRSRGEASRALAAVSGEIATNPELRQAWHRGLREVRHSLRHVHRQLGNQDHRQDPGARQGHR
jgi:AcrR family transcriptional regulator